MIDIYSNNKQIKYDYDYNLKYNLIFMNNSAHYVVLFIKNDQKIYFIDVVFRWCFEVPDAPNFKSKIMTKNLINISTFHSIFVLTINYEKYYYLKLIM